MVHRGSAAPARVRALLLAAALVATLLVVQLAGRAGADDVRTRCDRFAAAAEARSAATAGGADIAVIGDSYAVGLGLDRPQDSWPSRLPGTVHVAGFSGSGFSRTASSCGAVSFAARAPEAVRRSGARLVVVEGGLNDWDQAPAAIVAGFEALIRAVGDRELVVVGPPSAPRRSARVPAVDALLAGLAASHGVTYVRTSDLDLTYLDDRLHLTAAGHRAFGDAVAAALGAGSGPGA